MTREKTKQNSLCCLYQINVCLENRLDIFIDGERWMGKTNHPKRKKVGKLFLIPSKINVERLTESVASVNN